MQQISQTFVQKRRAEINRLRNGYEIAILISVYIQEKEEVVEKDIETFDGVF